MQNDITKELRIISLETEVPYNCNKLSVWRKYRYVLVFLLVILGIYLFLTIKSNQTAHFYSNEYRFSMDFPEAWNVQSAFVLKNLLARASTDDMEASIAIFVEPSQQQYRSFDSINQEDLELYAAEQKANYIDLLDKVYQNQLSVTDISSKIVSINGKRYVQLEAIYPAKIARRDIQITSWIGIYQETNYNVTANFNKDDKSMRKLVYDTAATIHIGD